MSKFCDVRAKRTLPRDVRSSKQRSRALTTTQARAFAGV